ncbi:unnamed protein product [Ectocarpus sp. 8 AP-2014]
MCTSWSVSSTSWETLSGCSLTCPQASRTSSTSLSRASSRTARASCTALGRGAPPWSRTPCRVPSTRLTRSRGPSGTRYPSSRSTRTTGRGECARGSSRARRWQTVWPKVRRSSAEAFSRASLVSSWSRTSVRRRKGFSASGRGWSRGLSESRSSPWWECSTWAREPSRASETPRGWTRTRTTTARAPTDQAGRTAGVAPSCSDGPLFFFSPTFRRKTAEPAAAAAAAAAIPQASWSNFGRFSLGLWRRRRRRRRRRWRRYRRRQACGGGRASLPSGKTAEDVRAARGDGPLHMGDGGGAGGAAGGDEGRRGLPQRENPVVPKADAPRSALTWTRHPVLVFLNHHHRQE